jgi:tRNA 2-selenouridine synthase
MPFVLNLKEFLQEAGPILDVRTPSEYEQGHIPESILFPLFSDAERADIGSVYKKQSRQEAIELGLILIQPKLEKLFAQALCLLTSVGKVVCWRGGMRSGFVAHLLELLGYKIHSLQGGYKMYRRWALQRLERLCPHFNPVSLYVLGGLTGSGKTQILHALQRMGEQVIDLEALANHRGSAFGAIGLTRQSTQEQFENELALALERIDWSKPIWIEDESRLIGRCHLPTALHESMLRSPLFCIQRNHSERLQHLLAQYGQAPKQELLEATKKIAKRLGSQLSIEIQQLLEYSKNEQAFDRLLSYYDKTYQYQIAKRNVVYLLQDNNLSSPEEWAGALQTFYRQKLI